MEFGLEDAHDRFGYCVVGQITDVCAEQPDQGVSLLIVEEQARGVLDIAEVVVLLSLDGARGQVHGKASTLTRWLADSSARVPSSRCSNGQKVAL